MKLKDLILVYLIATVLFFLADLLWLGVIAKDLYQSYLGDILKENTNWFAAICFYLIYISGIVYFSILPSLKSLNPWLALKNGAFLGFLCYSTFELTSLALIKNWPLGIVWIDILWGVFLTGSISYLSHLLFQRLKKI